MGERSMQHPLTEAKGRTRKIPRTAETWGRGTDESSSCKNIAPDSRRRSCGLAAFRIISLQLVKHIYWGQAGFCLVPWRIISTNGFVLWIATTDAFTCLRKYFWFIYWIIIPNCTTWLHRYKISCFCSEDWALDIKEIKMLWQEGPDTQHPRHCQVLSHSTHTC